VSSQLIKLIESWHSIQFNIEASLIDWQAWCPIATCEYHLKGFARKYGKNRHTLTHYEGTMVCSFCPGSGSAAEKGFNRADVFKRHLISVHGVEQAPSNSRKKSSTGKKAYTISDEPGGHLLNLLSNLCQRAGIL
jgi:hypothetical protein